MPGLVKLPSTNTRTITAASSKALATVPVNRPHSRDTAMNKSFLPGFLKSAANNGVEPADVSTTLTGPTSSVASSDAFSDWAKAVPSTKLRNRSSVAVLLITYFLRCASSATREMRLFPAGMRRKIISTTPRQAAEKDTTGLLSEDDSFGERVNSEPG